MSDTKIQWHSGFVSAIDLEFGENRKDLEYKKEYNLNTKPLEIDLLIIKKNPDVQISNELGRLFRGHNILEYKSPGDHLDIDTFYKSQAYACLYKSYGRTVDARKAEDITVSIIRDARPAGLFGHFKEHGIRVTNPFSGIYYISENVLFPTQIIVSRELDRESHTWLTALSGGKQKQEMREFFQKVGNLTQKADRELADSVLEVSIRANIGIVEELRGEDNMCQALLEIMEPEINKIKEAEAKKARQQGMQQGIQQGMQQGMQQGIQQGMQQGMQQGRIMGIVEVLRNLGQSSEEMKKNLVEQYHLSEKEAQEYLIEQEGG